jgi:hypothetical protein
MLKFFAFDVDRVLYASFIFIDWVTSDFSADLKESIECGTLRATTSSRFNSLF